MKEQTQRIKVGNEEGVVLYNESEDFVEILINHGSLTYLISLSIPKGDSSSEEWPGVSIKEILPQFNQILSTFRFD